MQYHVLLQFIYTAAICVKLLQFIYIAAICVNCCNLSILQKTLVFAFVFLFGVKHNKYDSQK